VRSRYLRGRAAAFRAAFSATFAKHRTFEGPVEGLEAVPEQESPPFQEVPRGLENGTLGAEKDPLRPEDVYSARTGLRVEVSEAASPASSAKVARADGGLCLEDGGFPDETGAVPHLVSLAVLLLALAAGPLVACDAQIQVTEEVGAAPVAACHVGRPPAEGCVKMAGHFDVGPNPTAGRREGVGRSPNFRPFSFSLSFPTPVISNSYHGTPWTSSGSGVGRPAPNSSYPGGIRE